MLNDGKDVVAEKMLCFGKDVMWWKRYHVAEKMLCDGEDVK